MDRLITCFSESIRGNNKLPILSQEVEEAIQSLKDHKATIIDNISAKLIKKGGMKMFDALTTICNKL